ncbi:MAG: hypothetical protein U0Q47_03840 [Mycobacterium sp.]
MGEESERLRIGTAEREHAMDRPGRRCRWSARRCPALAAEK